MWAVFVDGVDVYQTSSKAWALVQAARKGGVVVPRPTAIEQQLRGLLASLESGGVSREDAAYVTLGELMDRYGV